MHFEVYTEHEGYANEGLTIKLIMSEQAFLDARERIRYDVYVVSRQSIAYWGCDIQTGLVSFYVHNPQYGYGYGGAVYTLRMKDGTTREVRGPWSSNCADMNIHFPHTIEVAIQTERHLFSSYILTARTVGKLPHHQVVTDLAALVNPGTNRIHYKVVPR